MTAFDEERTHLSPMPGGPRSVSEPGHAGRLPEAIGRYRPVRVLGQGGMGVVFEAVDPALHRSVAIKMILGGTMDGEEIERFVREARLGARLRHPGIVAVLEVGSSGDRPFIVMDLVQGESLEALLRRGPVPLPRVVAIVRDVARALEHAHGLGVIHRDVKPQNILVDEAGQPRLTDFGLARDAAARDRLTATGSTLGTPAYMAPEQADGDPSAQGVGCDIWAVGAVLYRGVAGRPPFDGDSPIAIMHKLLTTVADPLRRHAPGVPRDVETIVMKCLEPSVERRYPSVGDVADELDRVLSDEPIEARPPGLLERVRRAVARRPAAVALAVVAVLAVAGAISTTAFTAAARARSRAAVVEAIGRTDGARPDREGASRQSAREAIEAASRALRLAEDHLALAGDEDARGLVWTASVRRGDISGAAGEWLVAIESYERARELRPTETTTIDLLARAWHGRLAAFRALADTTAERAAIEGLPPEVRAHPRIVTAEIALLRREGRLEEGRRLVSEALADRPDDAGLWARRGEMALALSMHAEALAALDAALRLDERLAGAWANRAQVRLLGGDAAGCVTDAERALALEPDLGAAFGWRAAARLELGEIASASTDASRAIELVPRFAVAWQVRATARFEQGDFRGAIVDATRAVELDPALGRAWRCRGAARAKVGELEGALSDFDRALEIAPNSHLERLGRAEVLFELDRPADALVEAERALAQSPDWVFARRRAARYAERAGDLARAEAHLERAVALEPGAPVWTRLAVVRSANGDVEGARTAADAALALDPDALDARLLRGFACFDRGDHLAAARDLERVAARLDSEDPRVHGVAVRLGVIFAAAERWLEAEAAFSDGLRAQPLDPGTWLRRAEVRRARSDRPGALEDIDRAIELAPELGAAWLLRGVLLAERPEGHEEARACFRRAAEVEPGGEVARRAAAALADLGRSD